MSVDPGRVRAAVGRVVDAEDPQGLLAMGAPADEYASEIGDLTALVLREPVTSHAVLVVWEHWFGEASRLRDSPTLPRLSEALAAVRRELVESG